MTLPALLRHTYHLADVDPSHPIRRAADEIERLSAALADAERRLHLQDAECAHMRAERDAARAECDALREANERFGKRQAWWTRTMFESESNRECLQAERDALRALLAEARPELLGEDYSTHRYCRSCSGYAGHEPTCMIARIDDALRSE